MSNEVTEVVVDELPAATEEEVAEINANTHMMLLRNYMHKEAVKAERAMKGVYCDWIFTNLNLTEYR